MGGGFKSSQASADRNHLDLYPTHHSLVWQIVPRLGLEGHHTILEPAMGHGDLVEALSESRADNEVITGDILTGQDYRLHEYPMVDVVMTNPPFRWASEFLERSKGLAREKIVFLLPLDFLHGADRYIDIWYKDGNAKIGEWALSEVHVFVRRPLFTDEVRPDGKYHTGAVTFAWFIWELWDGKIPGPIIQWIDNREYVIGSTHKNVVVPEQLNLFEE